MKTAYTINPADFFFNITEESRRLEIGRHRATNNENFSNKQNFENTSRPLPTLREGRTVKQKGRRADALALGADERRDKLR